MLFLEQLYVVAFAWYNQGHREGPWYNEDNAPTSHNLSVARQAYEHSPQYTVQ